MTSKKRTPDISPRRALADVLHGSEEAAGYILEALRDLGYELRPIEQVAEAADRTRGTDPAELDDMAADWQPAATLDVPALDEPTLTRILGELAPVIGGDLLTGGVPHRVGLASAILNALRGSEQPASGASRGQNGGQTTPEPNERSTK